MKLSPLRALQGLLLGAGTMLLSSCVYDASYGGYYGGGSSYGAGYSYGGYGTYNTSVFVSTSSPYWGYDPYRCLYYDYRRSCYYDPYLYGYYPRNYIPAYVYGCPHPYGWRPGYGTIRPPYRIRDYHLNSYRDRGDLYRRNNFSWARNYRERSGPAGSGRTDWRNDGRRDGDRSTWNDPRREGNRDTWNDPRRDSNRPSPSSGWRNPGSTSNPRPVTQPQPQTRPSSSRWTGREVPRSTQTTEPRVRPSAGQQSGGRPSYTPQPRSRGEVRPAPSHQPSQPRSSSGSNRSDRSEGSSSRESRAEAARDASFRNFR